MTYVSVVAVVDLHTYFVVYYYMLHADDAEDVDAVAVLGAILYKLLLLREAAGDALYL